MNFWERVDLILDEKGLTKKTLATEADFDQSNITKGIKANNIPSAETAVKIAKVLGVTVEYLVTGKSENPKQDYLQLGEQNKKYHSLIKDITSLSKEKQELVFKLIEELKN